MESSNEAGQAVSSTSEYGTEADLVDALRRRDRAACAGLVRQDMPRLYGLALRVTGNPEDAEDVMQESFIQACNRAATFEARNGSSLGSWLYRIVLNAALTHLRRRKPASLPLVEQPDAEHLTVPSALIDSAESPADHVLTHELRDTIDAAILALPDNLRAAFVLRDLEGLSTAEAASTLGITETALKVRLHRARLTLREALQPYLNDLRGVGDADRKGEAS
jgi:RNA polymerase sigma-70 factor, ECF subfamily